MSNVIELKAPAPERVLFRVVAHERLMGGGIKTIWRNDQLAISRVDLRPSKNEPWRTSYSVDALPGMAFATIRAARRALEEAREAS